MKSKALIIILSCLSYHTVAFAIAQYPDKIFFNNLEYSLQTNPLESYFKINPDKRPKTEMISSALWRGYVGTFEITGTELYLKDIEIETSEQDKDGRYIWKSVLTEVFLGKIKMVWYSGLLILPHGKLQNYVHLDYGSTFQNYILLNVKVGSLLKTRNLSGEKFIEFKMQKFSNYKDTEEYKIEKNTLMEDGWKQTDIDNFLMSFIESYITKDEE